MKRDAVRADVEGKRVLVVNDTEEILELFGAILGEMGLDVVLMTYAPREVDAVRAAEPDLVILDLIFGDREVLGWQLLQKIRMDRQLERIPIVVCTAAVTMARELEGYLTEQGVSIILKPFTVTQLEDAVAEALRAGGHPLPRSVSQSRARLRKDGGDA